MQPRSSRLQDLLLAAGVEKVTGAGLVGSCLGLGAFVTLVFFAVSKSWPISFCFGLFGAWLPVVVVQMAGQEADCRSAAALAGRC